jgi:uracil-DNA glycosylase
MTRRPETTKADLAPSAEAIASCVSCPRLSRYVAGFRDDPLYWAKPVPGFGDAKATLLILGLAPGAHGANRTGRPFTGDGAGEFLYRALSDAGASDRDVSIARDDGLRLKGAFITNVVKCAPPQNRPTPAEIARCAAHFDAELKALDSVAAVLALGRVAHDAWTRRVAKERGLRARDFPFAHGAVHRMAKDLPTLVDSYHPSRYNVNVGVLTYPMFLKAVTTAREEAAAARPPRAPKRSV